MSIRKLIIVAVPAVAMLILALIGVLGDGDSVAGLGETAEVLSASREAKGQGFGSSASMPFASEGPSVLLGSEQGAAGGSEDPDAGLLGRVHGKLVDAVGQAVVGEPVYLLRDRDAWTDPTDARSDDSALDRMLASAISGPDGQFELPARAGRRHELLAGGADWAVESVARVTSGDNLLVTMRDGLVLTGQVVHAETAMPVSGAHVLATAEDNVLLVTTGPDGKFSIGPLPSEVGSVGAWMPGLDVAFEFKIAPALGPIVLELGPGVDVLGTLVEGEQKLAIPLGTVRSVIDVEARLLGGEPGPAEHQLVEEREVKVNENGRFRLKGMPTRGFTLIAESPGFVPFKYRNYEQRNYPEGRVIFLKLERLMPLTGVVQDAESDTSVQGARLVAFGGQGLLGTATSDEEGEFELELDGWDGQRPLWIEASDGRGRTAREILDPKKYANSLELRLRSALRISALVVQDGQPVVGAEVALIGDAARISVGRTNLDGLVQLRHRPGSADLSALSLQARYLDMQSLLVALDIDELPEGPVTLDLAFGSWLVGRVVDPFGIPIPSARLDVSETKQEPHVSGTRVDSLRHRVWAPEGLGLRDLSTHSAEDGSFRLGPLRADVPHDLTVRAKGFNRRTLKQLLPDSDELEIRLEPVVKWEGRVVSATTGQPITSFSARLLKLSDGETPVFKTTRARVKHKLDEPGGFEVQLPEPGVFQLRVMVTNHITCYGEQVAFNGITPLPFATMLVWPAAVLEVTVETSRGQPVPGYSVAVIPWELASGAARPAGKVRKQGKTIRTNSKGLANFNLVEGGIYRVAGGPGVWFENLMLSVTPGPPVKRLYRLPSTGDLEITVLDEVGAPLSDVRVYLRTHKTEDQHSLYRRSTLRRGDFVAWFESLPPARYEIELRKRNYSTLKRVVVLSGMGVERVRIELQPRDKAGSSSKGGRSLLKSR